MPLPRALATTNCASYGGIRVTEAVPLTAHPVHLVLSLLAALFSRHILSNGRLNVPEPWKTRLLGSAMPTHPCRLSAESVKLGSLATLQCGAGMDHKCHVGRIGLT
jgi:hypothetical protein